MFTSVLVEEHTGYTVGVITWYGIGALAVVCDGSTLDCRELYSCRPRMKKALPVWKPRRLLAALRQ